MDEESFIDNKIDYINVLNKQTYHIIRFTDKCFLYLAVYDHIKIDSPIIL